MFYDSCVFILSVKGKVYRLDVDKETQDAICKVFSESVEFLINGKSFHDFEINYKPEDDEILRIKNFQLSDEIKEAIKNPLGLVTYEKDCNIKNANDDYNFEYPEIKAIFVGECVKNSDGEFFNIGFQKFRKEQNLMSLPFRLFFSNNTFKLEKRFEIGITYNIDCYYTGGELQFSSFHYARQVFDLSEYYRVASDPEVEDFLKNDLIDFENSEEFIKMANSYVRRKIAMINDSEVLKNYSANKISTIAEKSGIQILFKNNRIIIPADKNKALGVLAFLDEEAYRGPFTNALLIANSKRVLVK